MTFKEKLANLPSIMQARCNGVRYAIEAIDRNKVELQEDYRRLELVNQAARSLAHDWRCSLPGHGQTNAWFFVRSFQLDEGSRPTYYNPFWARELVDDLAKAEARMPDMQTAGKPAPPSFPGPNVLGDLSEASMMPCLECGAESCVVGERELCYWGDAEDHLWTQSLYTFCIQCPRLTRFAHREDSKYTVLHVK